MYITANDVEQSTDQYETFKIRLAKPMSETVTTQAVYAEPVLVETSRIKTETDPSLSINPYAAGLSHE